MANQDQIQQMLRDRFGGALDSAAQFGNTSGLNKALNNPLTKKLRMASLATKMTGVMGGGESLGMGSEAINDMITYGSGGMVAFGAAPSAKQTNQKLNEAMLRRQMQQSGNGTGFGDVKASTANTASNLKSAAMKGSALSMLGGFSPGALTSIGMGTGGLASSMAGGVSGLGGAATGAASSMAGMMGAGSGITGAIGAMNPVVAGMMTMMAMQKGGKKLFEMFNSNSSTSKQMDRKWTITKPLGAGELKEQYGMASVFGNRILIMQSNGQLSAAEALLANIMVAIETNTAVLPLMAAEQLNEVSRKEKEGGNTAQNKLDELFGSDGSDQIAISGQKKRALFEKIFGGLEQGSANLNSILDLGGQFSNLLEGKSSVALYNEANDKTKLADPLAAEKKHSEAMGISMSHTQVLNQSAAELIASVDSYDAKMLTLMGGIFTGVQLSGSELLKIRKDGFGISHGSSHGYLAQLRAEEEEKSAMEYSFYNDWLRGMDEMVGYLPGVASISNAFKAASRAESWLGDMIKGEAIRDEDGEITGRKEKRTMGKVFTDWISEDAKNKTLNSESELRAAVGAIEMGPAELMQNYLGGAYPDRFELLLKYNKHQMDSLAALAGPIAREEHKTLTLNKYDGVLGDQSYHDRKNKSISAKMMEQMGSLNPVMGRFSNWFIGENEDEILSDQIEEGSSKNSFLRDFLNGGIDSETDGSTAGRYQTQSKTRSVQDGQDAQQEEERREHVLSNSDKQLLLLQDIRDCVCCGSAGCGKGFGGKGGKGGNGGGGGGGMSLFGDIDYTGMPDITTNNNGKPTKPTKAPKASLWKKAKHFFTKGGWKKLLTLDNFKKGGKGLFLGIASIVRMIPFLGMVFGNPYVLGAMGIGIAAASLYAYSGDIYDWITNKSAEDKANDKRIEVMNDSHEDRLEELEKMTDLNGANAKYIAGQLDNRKLHSDADLLAYQEMTTDPMMQQALLIAIKKRRLHPDHGNTNQILGFNDFEKGGKKVFNNLSLEGKIQVYEDSLHGVGDNGSDDTRAYMKAKITQQQNRQAERDARQKAASGVSESEQTNEPSKKWIAKKMTGAFGQGTEYAKNQSDDIMDIPMNDIFKWGPRTRDRIDVEGLHPIVAYNLRAMGLEYSEQNNGEKMQINDAFRSIARQSAEYDADPSNAARPGNSMHNYGMAIDMQTDEIKKARAGGLFEKYGFGTPTTESWHVEPKGINRAKIRSGGRSVFVKTKRSDGKSAAIKATQAFVNNENSVQHREASKNASKYVAKKEKVYTSQQKAAITAANAQKEKEYAKDANTFKNVHSMIGKSAAGMTADGELSAGELINIKRRLEVEQKFVHDKEQLKHLQMQTQQLDLLIKAVMQSAKENNTKAVIKITRIDMSDSDTAISRILKANPVKQ